ncbi:ATP-binding protein [Proteus genomosp. 4]|uniref:ATP-binding protein n=1 Tax=Proteus genomosp. 4 TaxID=1311818 RepID=UPI001ABF1865|nr:ATP-binding protein [Proteus genomosp. 4]
MSTKAFDLNIEKILENWKVRHAVREIIANALDEQILTNTDQVQISNNGNNWIIRDFGRGITYTHLTQNENQEKLNARNVIGRFGIGLKDALATFERHGVECLIKSKYGIIKTTKMTKQGFGDITTLHAIIEEPLDTEFIGTEVKLSNIDDNEVEEAKLLFLNFSGSKVIDTTGYGQVIENNGDEGKIYINGVLVAREENFLFSYNITRLNTQLKKSINRERTNVGRSAYTDTVKRILLSSKNEVVIDKLADDMAGYEYGTMHDELSWIDVQEHAVSILNSSESVMFVTSEEGMMHSSLIDEARANGVRIVTIPHNLRMRIADSKDIEGNIINDINNFKQVYNNSFVFSFINETALSKAEKEIYQYKNEIVRIFGDLPDGVVDIQLSDTMRLDDMTMRETLGCWDPNSKCIVLSRKTLKSLSMFSGTLVHELVHAKTGLPDVNREFESVLTDEIGNAYHLLLINKKSNEINDNNIIEIKKPWYKFW